MNDYTYFKEAKMKSISLLLLKRAHNPIAESIAKPFPLLTEI